MTGPAAGRGRPVVVRGLTKTFGTVRAVDDLSFTVEPGRVTGFLGPNGAGKTTTLRMLLGLVRPDGGSASFGGETYAELSRPASVVGAALEAASFHPGRSARDHLRVYAPLAGVDDRRCDEVLATVGLDGVADRGVGGFSLGMRQRLGLATTLLADPDVLLLDEPANGLDPQGIVWLRDLLRHLAAEGRTVLVSSHVLGEVRATVDDVVVIVGGRLVHASSLEDLVALAQDEVRVTGPDLPGLRATLGAAGWEVADAGHELVVRGASAAQVGAASHAAGLELHGLTGMGQTLEEIFLDLVHRAEAEQAGHREPGAAVA